MRLAGAVLLALLPTAALADTIDHVETRADAPDGWDRGRSARWKRSSYPGRDPVRTMMS